MRCPHCGSENVQIQTFQEQRESKTVTKHKFKAAEQKHGCIWWLAVGWWWSIIDLFMWFFMFFPRLVMRLFAAPFKKKKYVGSGTSVSKTQNKIEYKTIFVCQNCGKRWDR